MLKSLKIKLFSLFLVLFFAGNVQAVSLPTTAEVQPAIIVTTGTSMAFGNFVTGAGGGSVIMPSDGAGLTVTGDVLHVGSDVLGTVNVDTGGFAGLTVTVTVTGGTLTEPGTDTMTFTGNCTGPAGTIGAADGDCTYSSGATPDSVDIGGVLTVGAAQTADIYTGTVDVVASF